MDDSILNIVQRYCGREAAEKIIFIQKKHEEFFLNLPRFPDEERQPPSEPSFIQVQMIASVSSNYLKLDELLNMLFEIGKAYLTQNQMSIALETFQFLLQDDRLPSHLKAEILIEKADILLKLNHWDECKTAIIEALQLSDNLNQIESLARANNLMAIWCFENGKFKTGLEYLETAGTIGKEINDIRTIRTVLLHQAIVNHITGNFDNILLYCDEAEKYTEPQEKLFLSKLNHIRSIIYKDLLRFDKALEFCDRALELAQEIKNRYQLACVKLTRSEILLMTSRFEEARQELQQAYRIFHQEGDKLGTADAYRIFGLLNIFHQNYKLAEANLNIALEISRNLNNLHSLGEIFIAKTLLALKSGERIKANSFLNEAENYFQKIEAIKRIELEKRKWQINL